MAHALLASTLWLCLLVFSDASALIVKKAEAKLPTGWAYQGCYSNADSTHILRYQQPVSTTLTTEDCIAKCHEEGYSFGGIHKSNQCFCDNDLDDNQNEAAVGDQDGESCGGSSRMSIYAKRSLTVRQAAGPQRSGLPGSWTYQGCITEGVGARVWKYQIINQGTNTATACLSQCQKFGYQAAGLEYGSECCEYWPN
ncbi:MAG: hypothetical protein Q9174_002933 [Haloplaca sp. 1 TL-2023]